MIPTPGGVRVAHNPSDFRHGGRWLVDRGADEAVMPEGKKQEARRAERERVVDECKSVQSGLLMRGEIGRR